MKIVQLANAYSPTSGGLRTVVDALGRGYVAAGHERVLVIPGRRHSRVESAAGLVVTLPGVPVSGGYRMIPRFAPVRALLAELEPDSVEVSDKATLAAAGPWARAQGVGAVLISHERLDAVAAARFPLLWRAGHRVLRPVLHRRSRSLADGFDVVVVASDFAGQEFDGTAAQLRRVPLGVDLDTFHPLSPESGVEDLQAARVAKSAHTAQGGSAERSAERPWRLVYSGRLSVEKHPAAAIAAVKALTAAAVPVHLDVYGSGSQRRRLEREAADFPVTFHGHLDGRGALAARIAAADVVIAPGPAETFGLSVLEALACGTPVVTADTGGAGELLSHRTGLAAGSNGPDLARAVSEVLSWPESERRSAARARAEQFPWTATITALLDVHTTLSARPRNPFAELRALR